MHYKNGREAKVGDIVQGHGYNIKHEIIGIMTKIHGGETSCNCEVACISSGSLVFVHAIPGPAPSSSERYSFFCGVEGPYKPYRVEPTIEYGQCDAFLALDPNTGDVLLPEAPKEKAAIA